MCCPLSPPGGCVYVCVHVCMYMRVYTSVCAYACVCEVLGAHTSSAGLSLALSPMNGFLLNVHHLPPTSPQFSASAGLQLIQAQSKNSQYIHVETLLQMFAMQRARSDEESQTRGARLGTGSEPGLTLH